MVLRNIVKMAHDIVSDALNQIRNASNARKKNVVVRRYSKVLLGVLQIMKDAKNLESYRINPENNTVEITINKIMECRAIKPRFTIGKDELDKYLERYLPARDYGIMVVSTNQGLMTHEEAREKKLGGCLIAFFY